jgi:hypothetical protein
MAELEPGHPDELLERLTNWLNEANNPTGSLPPNLTPTEWAVRNFIDTWRLPVRAGLDSVEESLKRALAALKTGNTDAAVSEIECSLQTLGEDVRDELGLYDWNRERT